MTFEFPANYFSKKRYMVIQFVGDWFSYDNDYGYRLYEGRYPSSGGSFTVIWESDTEIDVSLCDISYYAYDGTDNVFPLHLVSEDIGSNRVERTYLAPYKYGVWGIYNGFIQVEAFYDNDMLAALRYDSEYIFMFPDALGIATTSQTIRPSEKHPQFIFNNFIKGAFVGYVEYISPLYDRTPGAFITQIDYRNNTTDISLSTVYDGIEQTGTFATSSSGNASVVFKAKNVLSIDFIDGYSYRYGDYRFYNMPSLGIGETRMVKVRVLSNNGFPVTGEKVTARLQHNSGTSEIERVSYTDYGTYTEVEFEINLNTNPDYTYLLVSYEDDNYLLKDISTTQNLGTIYPTNVLGFEVASLWSVIPSDIEEETDTPISVTYATGGNLTFNTPDDVIITIDAETDNGNGTTTATGTIRVNEENTAGQITISISDGADTITRTITILEKEPPMAAPTISINRYADLSFPQEGGIKYITITYGNSSTEFINAPYSTIPRVTITPQSTTEIDNGVEIYYAVSVPSTTYERDIPLIFSCSNAQGTSTTETFFGMQAGEVLDSGITLTPESMTIPAAGGYFENAVKAVFSNTDGNHQTTVKVYTVKEDGQLILISNHSEAWLQCFLNSYGGDSTRTEYYDIKCKANTFSEPNTGMVLFSYTDVSGVQKSDTFLVVQAASDTEAPSSSLALYRTIMRFDANGVFDYSDATCTADYRWTNEEDIEEPVISDDWVVLTEQTHQTGAGYIKIPWGVAVARNTSTSDRTATVTFRSIGQDNVEHQAVLTVTQYGVEGKDETLEYVDLLWKDCEVVLGDDDVTFEILDERYNRFYTGRCQKRPNGEKNTFLINKIIQDYVWMEEIPSLLNGTSAYQEHPNGYRKFMLDTPDTVGAMKSYFFKYDWSYQEGSPFVLSESIVPYVVEGQKNLITYCNLDYSNPQTDVYTWVKKDGTTENGGISAENEEYATRVVSMPANADSYFLSGQRYEVINPCQSRYVLYYLSPKGGWCWFPIMGKVNSSDRLTSFTLTKNYDNTTAQFGKTRYTVDISTDYELSTGFLTQAQSLRMWEMLESNMVYMHDLEKDVIFPVVMKSDTVEKKRYQRGQTKMLSYTFGVETSQGRMRI